MHRPTLGIIAAALLAVGVGLTVLQVEGTQAEAFRAACWRIGAVLFTVFLAQPQLKRLPAWAVPALLVSLVIVVLRPRLLPVVLIVLILVAILRPRKKRPPPTARRADRPRSRSTR